MRKITQKKTRSIVLNSEIFNLLLEVLAAIKRNGTMPLPANICLINIAFEACFKAEAIELFLVEKKVLVVYASFVSRTQTHKDDLQRLKRRR